MAGILSEKIREERANAAPNGMVDRQPPLIPDWCLQLVVFVLAFATVVSRRPDAVFNAQFWAEDGKFWYADAYNTGGIGIFLQPYYGYLHLVPRLTALVAQALPLRLGPLLFNLVAIVIEILPVQLLVSSRLSALGSVSARLWLGFLCLSLPHTANIHSNITNAQWHLALLAFLVLISTPARNWGWRSFDILAVVSSSLSGPFAFMLAPVAGFITSVVSMAASSVVPSAGDFATMVAAMPVLAPGRFSITTPCPQSSDSFCPTIRMLTSVGPPAGNGTTILTGRLGKLCASLFCAYAGPAETVASNARASSVRIVRRRACA